MRAPLRSLTTVRPPWTPCSMCMPPRSIERTWPLGRTLAFPPPFRETFLPGAVWLPGLVRLAFAGPPLLPPPAGPPLPTFAGPPLPAFAGPPLLPPAGPGLLVFAPLGPRLVAPPAAPGLALPAAPLGLAPPAAPPGLAPPPGAAFAAGLLGAAFGAEALGAGALGFF